MTDTERMAADVTACRRDCGHFALSSATPGEARDVAWLCDMVDALQAERDSLAAALQEVTDEFEDALGYVSPHFRLKWRYDEVLA